MPSRTPGRPRRVAAAILAAMMAAGAPCAAAPARTVLLDSHPSGATVYADGKELGTTPLELPLTEEAQRIRLVKPGYLENSRTVRAGGARSLNVALTELAASDRRTAGGIRTQTDEPAPTTEKKKGGGGAGKAVLIGVGIAAIGAGVYAALPKNKPPVAGQPTASSAGGLVSVTSFTFTATGASDPDGDALTFTWDFGDGSNGSGQTAAKVYSQAGTYAVQVTVSDGKKSVTSSSLSVTVKSLSGAWSGTIAGSFPFTMQLTQSGTSVSGSYSDSDGPGTVSGTVSAPLKVSLRVTQPPFLPFTFSGDLDASVDRMNGTVGDQTFSVGFTMSRR